MSESVPRTPTARVVAPEIALLAGDVSRPTAVVPFSRDLGHLPGPAGLLAGVQSVWGVMQQGEAYFARLIRRYGPVFRHMVGTSPVVCVADPDLIWRVVRNEESAWSAALPWTYYFGGIFASSTSDGPLTLDFEPHQDVRRLLQPAFSAPALGAYLDDARAVFEPVIADWIRRGRIRFKPEVRRLFASVSSRILMGIDDPAEAAMLDRAMTDAWQAALALLRRSSFSPRWRRARRGVDTLWNALRPRMAERRRGGADLLSRICQTNGEAAWLDDDTRMRIFIAVLFAAFDTISSGTTSMAYLLARHPSWQERLRREACGLASSAPTPADLKALEQHEWVWNETLRLFPVAGQISRQALHELRLGEHRIPAAACVLALTGSAARDPRWWSSPGQFDPERFSPARAEDKRHKAIFLPFGAGAHTCIGAQLADIESKAFWHALLTRCRIELVDNSEPRHVYRPVGTISSDLELALVPL